MKEEPKKRVEYIDVARGIAIILMVIGHILDINNIFRKIIFSFHMPIFIIISGYFYKDSSTKDFIINTIKKLVIPYVIAVLCFDIIDSYEKGIIYILTRFSKQIIFSTMSVAYLKYTDSSSMIDCLWFIPMLIITKILFRLIKKILKNNELQIVFCIFLFLCLGFQLGKIKYWLPFSIDVSMSCLIFFYLGYILKKYDGLNKILNDNISIFILFIIWVITIKLNYKVELVIRAYSIFPLSIIGAISGSIVVFKISQIISLKVKILSDILSWYGKNSIFILIMHYLEKNIIPYDRFFVVQEHIILINYIKLLIVTIGTLIIENTYKLVNNSKLCIK